MQQTEYFVILDHILPFYPPQQPRKSKFWKNEEQSWRYYHFTHVYHKWRSYDLWFLRYGVWQTEVFVILDHFLPFYPPNNLENQSFEKIKNNLGDIIILHMCIINNNHMIYSSWDMECDRQNFLSFWAIFYPFTHLTIRKIKVLKKLENPGDIIILQMCTINEIHMMYASWGMERNRQNLPKNQSFEKMKKTKNKKNAWRHHHFTQVHQK